MDHEGRLVRSGGKSLPLSRCPFPRALAEISAEKLTGTLSVSAGNLEKHIVIKAGAPVYVQSNIAEESLDQFLVSRGELPEAVAFEALSKATMRKVDIADVLVEMGALQPHELFKGIKRCLGMSILSVFAWDDGELRFNDSEPDVERKILLRVNPAPLVFRGVCSYTPLEMVRADFDDDLSQEFILLPGTEEFVPSLRFNTTESRVVNALRKPNNQESLVTEARVDSELVERMLYGLALLGAVGRADELEPEERESASKALPVQPTEAPTEHADAPAMQREVEVLSAPDPGRGSQPNVSFLTRTPATHTPAPAATRQPPPGTMRVPTAATRQPIREATRQPTPAVTRQPIPAATRQPIPAATAQTTPATTSAATRQPTPAPIQTPTPPPAGPQRLTTEEVNAIDALYLVAKRRNYFHLLGVPENFRFDQLKRAFLDKCNEFSPAAYQERDVGEQADRIEELFLILVRAFSTLAVPATRSAHRDEVDKERAATPSSARVPPATSTRTPSKIKFTSAAKPKPAKPKPAKPKPVREKPKPEPAPQEPRRNAFAVAEPRNATVHIRTAVTFINAGSPAQAARGLRELIDNEPDNAMALSFLGYATYLADPVSSLSEAVRYIQRALAINAQCVEPMLFLGRIFEFQQDRANALSAYQGCLQIDAGNREASDAVQRLQQLVK